MDAMLSGMSAVQLQEWRAYADLEPFDEIREDYRVASIVQAVFNAAVLVATRGKKQGKVKLKDCLLPFGQQTPKQRTEAEAVADMVNTMSILMAIHNPPEPKKRARKK